MRPFVKRRNMSPHERVSVLRGKLYQKAKQERDYKFYVLYDKVFLSYVLEIAWKTVKSKDGAPGIDGVSISDIEGGDVGQFLHELG